jgi:DNA-binding transcriptional regulator YdaS (Cro superfamily)
MAGVGHNSRAAEPPLLGALDVFAELRRACLSAGGQKAWAEAHGITPQHLNDVINCRREFSPRILEALGLIRVERYARVSISRAKAA